MASSIPLRPFLPADTPALRELFAQSIEELTADDYDEDQRIAWARSAADADAFAKKLASMTTLVALVGGSHAGFAALKNNDTVEMLFVHPHYAGQGVGSALAEAVERLAQGRGTKEISVEASDTAEAFFADRGYQAMQRNMVPRDDQWLANTTMKKRLGAVDNDS
ncbi:GNAT family N-acetyltransferase [Hyphomicrobium sulfonivorans]|uniref:GNAT family N-acetyltransferase n=1 Tax=Hyphomicrobium sulfonivorans TaxID=121290 RepID=UPI00157047A9|nr:GNAT family N-acetyltransferase [Hyphomicrobium sulfonivorans]MBI1650354.1 GNAT family N-acetyltransferase [Hyphomicrobium sulfonivorans]NSL72281.1 GNAT family N-acetyltransferase [Hyphomicrobium sulfonivorans]